jgi:predicted permease
VAVRLALGVRHGRLVAQSLTESVVLSLTGCVAGLAVAQWGGAALRQLFLPSTGVVGVAADSRTLGVALGAALVAGVLTGFAPLLLARGTDIAKTLKAGVREGTNQRPKMRATLLVVQVMLSVVLLVAAGLFVRSLGRLRDVRLGYDVDPVLLVQWHRRGESMTMEQRVPLRERVLEAATALPGVTHAAWASNIPLQGTSTAPLFVPGIDSVARLGRFTYQSAGADYFATVGTRILRGRGFTAADRSGAPTVAVVSASMARVLWPGQDALGRCIRFNADTMPCATVVGVAEDAVHDPLADQPLRYYLPMDQFPTEGGSYLLLRVRGDPAEMAETVRRALQVVMPGQQYVTAQPVSDLLDAQRHSWRAGAAMFVAFGVLALVVAAVGLYGVIAYDVGQRMHELGVRIALGAHGADVVRLVVVRGLRLAVAGIAVGSALAVGAGRWIEPLLFRQSATDPAVFGLVAFVLVAVAVAACSAPAARALRADPNTVLRSD